VTKKIMLDALDARHMAEHYLGFSANTADSVDYQQLRRAAQELRALRKMRYALEDLQEAIKEASRLEPKPKKRRHADERNKP
jgi:hypothetical protein